MTIRPDEPRVDGGQQAVPYWLDFLFERDYIMHSPVFITVPHHMQHGGKFWTFGTRLPALNGSVSYLFHVQGTAITTLRPHFENFLNSNNAIRGFLYQDPTVVDPGTLLGDPPIFNHLQGAGTSLSLEVYINPNISNPGTLRISIEIGAAQPGPQGIGGGGATRHENVFDNDKYWLAVIDTDEATIVNYEASWYEK